MSAIDCASSSSAASSKCWRGWLGLARICAMSISRTPPRCGRRGSLPRAARAPPRRTATTARARGRSPSSCRRRRDRLRQAPDHFLGEPDIGFRAGAFEVVDQGRQPVARRLAQADVARHDGVEHRRRRGRRGRPRRPAARDCCGGRTSSARRRGSTATGLKATRIRSTVWSNWLSPSSAKNSHCSGTSKWRAATRALTVSSPSDGGQSIMMMSQRPSGASSNAWLEAVGAIGQRDHFDLGARQVDRGGEQVEPRDARGDDGVLDLHFAEQHVVGANACAATGRRQARSRHCPADRGRRAAPSSRSRRARWRG